MLSTKGQIVIPAGIRERNKMRPGDCLEIEETQDGILIRKADRMKPRVIEKEGLLVFHADKPAPLITNELVKRLENELL